MPNSTIGTYVNDHLAMATSEIELLRRCADENERSDLAEFLTDVANTVETQASEMRQLLESQGQNENSIKQAAAWLVEKLGRAKPNDGGTGYTDLARVIELEALIGLAEARRLLWQSVNRMHLSESCLSDSLRFAREATDQLESLRDHHQQAVGTAFSTQTGATT